MQIFTSPQAMPQAMPQAEYQKFRIFQNIAPGFALRHCPRANKNLHMASGHASEFFRNFAPGRCPQATPQGKPKFAYALRLCLGQLFAPYLPLGMYYANLFDLRHSLEKYANFICPQGTPQATPQAKFQKFSEFSEFFRNLAPGVAPGYAAGLAALEGTKNLHILPSGYALSSLRQ
ncbi:hypothetical protein T4D_8574 [Trichinella pseudospiralis]|uniref:Uncharacterized protein n=1 Tax=Trichinella pseudospiralis TaxID=6337 RepID=A0A0V1FSV2_TRIPS|nr:hypothetical protein T4D_8574 [Trichinella pseudospiralis]